MRVIADILTVHKFLGFKFPEAESDEEERIIEIENCEGDLIIYIKDKNNTSIAISSEDLNAIM